MAKSRKVDPQALDDLLKRTPLPAVGATNAHPDLFPDELGIGRRTEPRNQLLGSVVTRICFARFHAESDPRKGVNESALRLLLLVRCASAFAADQSAWRLAVNASQS